MSRITFTKSAAPSTPATNKSTLYVDTADRKLKMLDDNGVISTFNNDGLQDRNILINGGFIIQQRMAVASTAIAGVSTTTRAGVVADRWAVTSSVATNLNWQQVDTGSAPETGLNSRYYGSIISATAGKKVMLSQWIINAEMAHLRGGKVRVSVKTSQKVGSEGQTFKLGLLQLTSSGTADTSPAFLSGAWSTTTGVDPSWGTNLAAITPDASPTGENGTINGNYLEISSTLAWKRSSAVFTVPTNAKNLVVVLFANATGGTTDNFSVAEFQLTQGPDIVEYREPAIAETIMRCQRFYSKSFPLTTVPAASLAVASAGAGSTNIIGKAAATALACQINIQFPIKMHATPTLTLFTPVAAGAVPYRINGTTPAVQTAVAQLGLTDTGAVVTATGDANGAIGDLVGVHWTADCEIKA
jgi:hypothetical protein